MACATSTPLCAARASRSSRPSRSQTASGSADLAILENVGNLVCPAEFDTGASVNVAILSVPEGDDKPLKYPLMFEVCDVVLVNKMDVAPYFDFDLTRCEENVRLRNPGAKVIPMSAKTGEGTGAWAAWLRAAVAAWKTGTFEKATPANSEAPHYQASNGGPAPASVRPRVRPSPRSASYAPTRRSDYDH